MRKSSANSRSNSANRMACNQRNNRIKANTVALEPYSTYSRAFYVSPNI